MTAAALPCDCASFSFRAVAAASRRLDLLSRTATSTSSAEAARSEWAAQHMQIAALGPTPAPAKQRVALSIVLPVDAGMVEVHPRRWFSARGLCAPLRRRGSFSNACDWHAICLL